MRIDGWVADGFEPVREAFAAVLAAQRGTGAAVAAWRDGGWVADLWGGPADAAGTKPWQRDSLVQPYSVSKPFVAMAALLLADRGLLDLDAPAQRYWPQLRARASVRQLLSHQAGVVVLGRPLRHRLRDRVDGQPRAVHTGGERAAGLPWTPAARWLNHNRRNPRNQPQPAATSTARRPLAPIPPRCPGL
jgi:CubicO group peptidase (beta-lactamase class C family)